MIELQRQPLSAATDGYLRRVSERVVSAAPGARAAVADRAWRNKSPVRFADVRGTLLSMCSGIDRCMYCEDSAATDIDHFVPKARDPTLAFAWTNYLAACSGCNSNYKRSEFPVDGNGQSLLVDPTAEDPSVHLAFSPTTGRYVAVDNSPKGVESIRVFGLNRQTLASARQDAWELLQLIIAEYAEATSQGDSRRAARMREIACRQPFAGVLAALLRYAASDLRQLVGLRCRQAIAQYPEIASWVSDLFA